MSRWFYWLLIALGPLVSFTTDNFVLLLFVAWLSFHLLVGMGWWEAAVIIWNKTVGRA